MNSQVETVTLLGDGPLTTSSLARQLGITYKSAASRLARLLGSGLVVRIAAPPGRRFGQKGAFAKFEFALTVRGQNALLLHRSITTAGNGKHETQET